MPDLTKKREANIELLRIFSMFLILLLHAIYYGGFLTNTTPFSLNYYSATILHSLTCVCVNCYVLISGYFLITKKFKARTLVSLWLKTFFYSFGIFCVLALFDLVKITPGAVLNAGLPVIMNRYWFIPVYMALYLLFPFLNLMINKLSQKQHKALLAASLIIFSVWNTLFPISESFDILNGHSVAWFIILYITGAYIRLYYKPKYNKYICLLMYLLMSALPGLVKIIFTAISQFTGIGVIEKYADYLVVFNSLPVYIASVALFLFFLRIRIKRQITQKIILFISPLTFGVYLIHEQLNLSQLLWTDFLHIDTLTNSPWMVPLVLLACIAIFAAACAIDLLRTWLFRAVRKTHKNDILSKLENRIDLFYENSTSSEQ